MEIMPLISLVSFIAGIVMGLLVFMRSPKSLTNRLYTAMIVFAVTQSMIDYGYFQARSLEQACFWWKFDKVWPLTISLLMALVLTFVEKEELLKKKKVLAAIFLPAITIILVDVLFGAITKPPRQFGTGWSYGGFKDTTAANLAGLWQIALYIVMLVILGRFLRKERNHIKWRRVRIVLYVVLFTLTIFLTEALQQPWKMLGIDIASTYTVIVTMINGIIAYAIWRYDMFALSPVTVAEHIVMAISDTMLLVNHDHRIESCNDSGLATLEYSKKEIMYKRVREIFDVQAALPEWLTGEVVEKKRGGARYIETRFKSKNGKGLPVSLSSAVLHDKNGNRIGYLMIARDIQDRIRREQELRVFQNHLEKLVAKRTEQLNDTIESLKKEAAQREAVEQERRSLEEERKSLEEQLFHAQKLESIGRLAGGVAHDFNNLLFVINAYSEGFVTQLDEHDPLFEDFREIHQAADRATSLTQQLLAFSRKQIARPRIIDPNDAVKELHKMLGRIIGENIIFNIVPGLNVGKIRIDPGQLDQILINLAINAKDAIEVSGTITVEVNQRILSEEDCQKHDAVTPGPFTVIKFSDTGAGMDEETLARIFDPFFTTKDPGEGTGLGLSTIYGIMKQNGGFMAVDSELGKGATFELYFPKYEPENDRAMKPMSFIAPKGYETILLVEDDHQVRRLAARLLRQLGYTVHEASGAAEATHIFHECRKNIDLLFTDVVMPGMTGKQLSKLLSMSHPQLKVLFMSGYNQEITDQQGRLESATNFIAKPFSSGDLSIKIREVLDA